MKNWQNLGSLAQARNQNEEAEKNKPKFKIKRVYDLIIIGCGPSGLAASIYASRQKLDFCVITKDVGGMTNLNPYPIENYLGYHYVTGVELEQKFEEHFRSFNPPTIYDKVRKIEKTNQGFLVTTESSNFFDCKAVVIATGRINKPLNVPGELDFAGKGISFCAHCDAPLFRDKVVAVVGGGRTGLDSALQLLNIAKKVYLVEIGNKIREEEPIAKLVKTASKVEVLTSTKVLEIVGDNVVRGIKILKDKKQEIIKVDGIFISVGYGPNTEFLGNLVRMNDRREIIINENNMSSVPGIFAAGDCTSVKEKQVLVAAGEGVKALISASEFLHLGKANILKVVIPIKSKR